MPLQECENKCDDTDIRLHTTLVLNRQTDRQTDRQTELVEQYRALHALHTDAR